jgi:hypothetical protein
LDYVESGKWKKHTPRGGPLVRLWTKLYPFGPLLQKLRDLNIFNLNEAREGNPQTQGRSGWRSEESLGISGELVEEWRSYVGPPCENHISYG